jgi:hypothetical protein
MLEYAALVASPRALPDGLILVFNTLLNVARLYLKKPAQPRLPQAISFHIIIPNDNVNENHLGRL